MLPRAPAPAAASCRLLSLNVPRYRRKNKQVVTDEVQNTAALGMILYDQYFLLFQLSGLILLVAMIGAIVLTLRHRVDVKRQNVVSQMMRDPKLAMKLNDVKPGQGL